MRVNHKLFRCWENPVSGKYYLAYIARDLFGEWNVVKIWGKGRQTTASMKSMPCQSWEEALDVFRRTQQKRLHRGYQFVCTNL